MRGLLGKKIGEGVSADVHAWAPGQVVKLFKSAASRRLGWHEAQKTDAVFAAGAPAPQVFGVVTPRRVASASCCRASTDRPCCSSCGPAP
jgi:hypothetical protein